MLAAQRRRQRRAKQAERMTMITENGTDQLSYSAAVHRNTTRIEMAYRLIAAAGQLFLQRNAAPRPCGARRQAVGQLFHLVHRRAGAEAGGVFAPISKAAEPL